MQKLRLPATRDELLGRADQSQQTGLHLSCVFEDAEIGFVEISSLRIKRRISNIEACNRILVVPPNAVIHPKKSMIWDL